MSPSRAVDVIYLLLGQPRTNMRPPSPDETAEALRLAIRAMEREGAELVEPPETIEEAKAAYLKERDRKRGVTLVLDDGDPGDENDDGGTCPIHGRTAWDGKDCARC